MEPSRDPPLETGTQVEPAVVRERLLRLLHLLAKGVVRDMKAGGGEKQSAEYRIPN